MFRIAAIFLILSASANAADPWTRTDTAYEIAYQVADYMDWRQTREFTQASYYTLGKPVKPEVLLKTIEDNIKK